MAKPDIKKIEQPISPMINSAQYEHKFAEIIKDDYGNDVTIYRKRSINEAAIDADIVSLEKQLEEKKAIKAEIVKLK